MIVDTLLHRVLSPLSVECCGVRVHGCHCFEPWLLWLWAMVAIKVSHVMLCNHTTVVWCCWAAWLGTQSGLWTLQVTECQAGSSLCPVQPLAGVESEMCLKRLLLMTLTLAATCGQFCHFSFQRDVRKSCDLIGSFLHQLLQGSFGTDKGLM